MNKASCQTIESAPVGASKDETKELAIETLIRKSFARPTEH
jgi:hypothetical protein